MELLCFHYTRDELLKKDAVYLTVTIETLQTELIAWEIERNNLEAKVNWHFRTKDARVKLVSLYPEL